MAAKFNSVHAAFQAAHDLAAQTQNKVEGHSIDADDLGKKLGKIAGNLKFGLKDKSEISGENLHLLFDVGDQLKTLIAKYRSLSENPKKGVLSKTDKILSQIESKR